MTARMTIAMVPSNARSLFLLKNLNVAPSADSFQPVRDFVIQFLLDDIHANHFHHLLEGRNRIDAAAPSFRHEHIGVVHADFLVGSPEELTETHVEKLLHPQALADGFPNG